MTLESVIAFVDELRPNDLSPEAKTKFINEMEGFVQTEVMLLSGSDLVSYDYGENWDTELMVKSPHDKIYWQYLCAMVDFACGDYDRYRASMELCETSLNEFVRWYARRYAPAAGECVTRGYYLSAYSIACAHGFEGTESQWLKSLRPGFAYGPELPDEASEGDVFLLTE